MTLDLRARSAWQTPAVTPGGHPIGTAHEWVVHHTAVPDLLAGASTADIIRALRGIDHVHRENGWGPGTGYNFLISGDGVVWTGRGWRRSGAHVPSRRKGVKVNDDSVGVAFLIHGSKRDTSVKAWAALGQLILAGERGGQVAKGSPIVGHRHYNKPECPGSKITDTEMKGLRTAANKVLGL